MLGQDSAVMKVSLDEVDYAAKLIRIPPRLHAGTSGNDSMFHNSIKNALGKDISTGSHGKHKADRNDKKLMDTCIEMESLLVAKMLKEMRHTVHKTGWIDGGPGVGIETPNYHGYDFISLFWGDANADLVAHLTDCQRAAVEAGLEEAFI